MTFWELKKLFSPVPFRLLVLFMLLANMLLVTFGSADSPSDEALQAYRERYASDISYTVRIAERNINEYGQNGENYTVRYQRQVVRLYSALIDADVTPRKVAGWNEYFSVITDDLLLILFAILSGAVLSVTEKDSGMDAFLYMTRRGRRGGYAKAAALFITSAAAVAGCVLSSLAAVLMKYGVSSPMSPICSVMRFEYCPFNISLLDYLLISSCIRLWGIWGMALFSLCLAKLSGSYLVTLVAGAGLMGAGVIASVQKSVQSAILLNPYTLCTVDGIFERYRSVDMFGASVPLLTAGIFILFAWAVIFAAMACLHAQFRGALSFGTVLRKAIQRHSGRFVRKKRRYCRHGAFYWEAKKHFVSSKLIWLCVVMAAVKLCWAVSAAPKVDLPETDYRQSCYELAGELTEEKKAYIEMQLSNARQVISEYDRMHSAAYNGSIGMDEYHSYMQRYNEALIKESTFVRLERQCRRIMLAGSRGIDGMILYDTGWLALLGTKQDIILDLFLILFFCGSYSFEQRDQMLGFSKTIRRGSARIGKDKMKLALAVSAAAFAVFFGIDMILLLKAYSFPSPFCSLASIADTPSGIPIIAAVGGMLMGRLLFSVAVAWVTLMVSRLTKQVYFVVPIMVILMIPIMI